MQQTCSLCSSSFEVTDTDKVFYEKASPSAKGQKLLLPVPTHCPDCRVQRRMTWRNDRTFYKRKCDLTGEEFVSIYPADSPYTVYRPSAWYSDEWDPMEYGQEYDFDKPFFEQFKELMLKVPRLGIDIINCQNSEYCNYCGDDKNCYLDIAGEANEDCYYNLFIKYCKNCTDCTFCYQSTLCYECIQCYNCYGCKYSQYLDDCSDCAFCYDLKGCKNCLLSTNLRNKEYYILNEEHTKEEYEKKLAELRLGSLSAVKNVSELWKKKRIENGIYRDMYNLNCENCTGNNIKNSKNCSHCFNATNCEDCKHLYDVLDAKDCQDLNYSLYKPEAAYELCSTLSMRFSAFCYASHYCTNCYYCDMINHSQNCFGCIGFSTGHKEYCILNKQYTQEEYEDLLPKITEKMQSDPSTSSGQGPEWGEFFPVSLSPFAYNETVAHEYMPLTKEEVESYGWRWLERMPEQEKRPEESVTPPDAISDTDDTLCEKVLTCEASSKPYRIIPQELAFYKKQGIPVPQRSPDQRHRDRIALRNPRRMWKRKCVKCETEIQTSYASDRAERVYCEDCYLKEVY